MKNRILITAILAAIAFNATAQKNYAKLADSLRYVREIPYIGCCCDTVLWEIIGAGKPIVPHLINKMTDTRKLKHLPVRFFSGKYTVADVAYVALQEIIADIPTFDLLGVPFNKECGYCSYWYHVRASKKNRKNFQEAVRRWYDENKDNLVWEESCSSVTSDCFPLPSGGHYVLQKKEDTVAHLGFKDYPPLRELQCGLWINSVGDIAYKEIGCEFDEEENDATTADTTTLFIREPRLVDQYLTWTYNVPDTVPDDISEEDFQRKFMLQLKDVVDTASVKILSPNFFMDKDFIYQYQYMACGGHIFVNRSIDRKTFRVFDDHPNVACDKNTCYVMGHPVEGADPETFRVVHDNEYLISRDKNHFYWNWDKMTNKEIRKMEQELGVELLTRGK